MLDSRRMRDVSGRQLGSGNSPTTCMSTFTSPIHRRSHGRGGMSSGLPGGWFDRGSARCWWPLCRNFPFRTYEKRLFDAEAIVAVSNAAIEFGKPFRRYRSDRPFRIRGGVIRTMIDHELVLAIANLERRTSIALKFSHENGQQLPFRFRGQLVHGRQVVSRFLYCRHRTSPREEPTADASYHASPRLVSGRVRYAGLGKPFRPQLARIAVSARPAGCVRVVATQRQPEIDAEAGALADDLGLGHL